MPGVFDRKRRRAIVRKISEDYEDALSTYFGTKRPDQVAAKYQHAGYVAALESCGVEVEILEVLEGHPDCCFVEDTAIIFEDTAVICNPGHPSRAGEVESIAKRLSKEFEIQKMPTDTMMDGGDVIFTGTELLIGLSTRTNANGVAFLSKFAAERNIPAQIIDVPKTTLHLTTVCSVPRNGTIIAAEGHLRPDQLEMFEEVIWVPEDEAYAANTIAFEDGRIIISEGFPITIERVRNAGFEPVIVPMSEIMQADGSLTCLSLFIG
jgi:dimethylargininase